MLPGDAQHLDEGPVTAAFPLRVFVIPVPVLILARLAVDQRHQGNGSGQVLEGNAVAQRSRLAFQDPQIVLGICDGLVPSHPAAMAGDDLALDQGHLVLCLPLLPAGHHRAGGGLDESTQGGGDALYSPTRIVWQSISV